MQRQVRELSLWLLVWSATGCHKNAELKEQPASAVIDAATPSASAPASALAPGLAAMMADDPGRCVKQIIVGDEAIAFEFNRDYYWYLGNIGSSVLRSQKPPFYELLPKHYAQIYLGSELSCGRNTDGSVECWGFDHFGMFNPKGTLLKAPAVLPGPNQLFALLGQGYCAVAGGKVTCPAPIGGGPGEVLALGIVNVLGKGGGDLGCGANDTQVWCWGAQWLPPHPLILPYSWRVAMPIGLPAGLRVQSLHVGSNHACVLGEDRAAYCFGRGDWGTWGNGRWGFCGLMRQPICKYTSTANYVATLGRRVKELGVGGSFACALKDDGSVWCWGSNDDHIVGNQENIVTSDTGTKMAIEPLPLLRSDLGTDNRSLKIGQYFACVEKNDGALWCWGNNRAMELAPVQSRFEPPHPIPLPAPRCAGAN